MCKHVEHCNNVFHQRMSLCLQHPAAPCAVLLCRQTGGAASPLSTVSTDRRYPQLYQFDVFSSNEQLRSASQHSPNTGEHSPVASLGQHSGKMSHDDIFIANSNFSSLVTNDTEHSAEAASPQRNIHSCPRCPRSSASAASPNCVRTCRMSQPLAMVNISLSVIIC